MQEIRDLDDDTRATLLMYVTARRPVDGNPEYVRVKRSTLGLEYQCSTLNPGRTKLYAALDRVAALAVEAEGTDRWDALPLHLRPAHGRDVLVTLQRPQHDGALWESLLEEVTGSLDWSAFLARHAGADMREPILRHDRLPLPAPTTGDADDDTDWTAVLHAPGAVKRCSRCGQTLPASAFGIREGQRSAHLESRCRACKIAAATESARRARERRRAAGRPGAPWRSPKPEGPERIYSGGPAGA